MPAPHNLETGDAVYYWAPASGGTAVGGLVSGKRYIVYVVDAFTLKLLDPLTMSTNPIESVSFNAGVVNGTNIDDDERLPERRRSHLPRAARPRTFSSAAVELAVDGAGQPSRNADNTPIYAGAGDDTIFLGSNPNSSGVFQTGHGYSTGDQITYRVRNPERLVHRRARHQRHDVHAEFRQLPHRRLRHRNDAARCGDDRAERDYVITNVTRS